MRIAIVDDNLDIATLLQVELEHAGHEVTATTGRFESLLSPAAWEGIEVAIIDLMLHDWGHAVPGRHPTPRAEAILNWLAQHQPEIRRVVWTALPPDGQPAYAQALAVVVEKGKDGLRTLMGVVDGG